MELTYDNAEHHLIHTQEALNGFGNRETRKEATRQFLDAKTFKPGRRAACVPGARPGDQHDWQ